MEKTADKDFVLVPVFDAPRELVWKAWTDPKHMARWWGPREFTNPVCQMDVRVGGALRIVMHGPKGTPYDKDFPFKGVFKEVVPPERLVYTNDMSEHGDDWHAKVNKNRPHANGKNIDNVITTVTFKEEGGKTHMEVRVSFASDEDRDALVKIGMSEGWSQSFEKLKELLVRA